MENNETAVENTVDKIEVDGVEIDRNDFDGEEFNEVTAVPMNIVFTSYSDKNSNINLSSVQHIVKSFVGQSVSAKYKAEFLELLSQVPEIGGKLVIDYMKGSVKNPKEFVGQFMRNVEFTLPIRIEHQVEMRTIRQEWNSHPVNSIANFARKLASIGETRDAYEVYCEVYDRYANDEANHSKRLLELREAVSAS